MESCITELKVGEKAKIVGFNSGDSSYRHRLLALGLIPETTFILTRIAPLGDPIEIRLTNRFFPYSLCLRKKEASMLQLQLEKT